jgi:hypothetical protein
LFTYSLIGLDLHPFITDNKLEPYIQIDTNKRYKKSNDTTSTCVLTEGWIGVTSSDFSDPICTLPVGGFRGCRWGVFGGVD